jgi:hypothetical protein
MYGVIGKIRGYSVFTCSSWTVSTPVTPGPTWRSPGKEDAHAAAVAGIEAVGLGWRGACPEILLLLLLLQAVGYVETLAGNPQTAPG